MLKLLIRAGIMTEFGNWSRNGRQLFHFRNSSTTNETDAQLPAFTTFFCAALMLVVCVLGAFGNVMSILVFTRRSMRSSINVLLTGLSVVDLSVLTLTIVVYVVPGLSEYLHFGSTTRLELVTLFSLYQFSMIAQTCSGLTFVLISLERYLAVCKPFLAQRMLTINRARYAQLSVVAFAVLYNLVRFWEYELVFPSNETSVETTTHRPLLRQEYYYFLGYYTISYVIIHFCAPFLLISVVHTAIIKTVANARALRQIIASRSSNAACQNGAQLDPAAVRDAKREGKLTRMIVVITVIFSLCNILPFFLNVWEAFEPSLFKKENPRAPAAYVILDISNILVILNSSTNFLVYTIYCRQYRSLCRLYVRRLIRCDFQMELTKERHLRRKLAKRNAYFGSLTDVFKAAGISAALVQDTTNSATSVVLRRHSPYMGKRTTETTSG